jgi:hypothetical protein
MHEKKKDRSRGKTKGGSGTQENTAHKQRVSSRTKMSGGTAGTAVIGVMTSHKTKHKRRNSICVENHDHQLPPFVLLRPELPEGITSTSKTAFISSSTPFEIKQQPHQKQQQINPQVMTKSTANRHSFQMVSKVKVNEFVGGLCHGIASATSSKKKHHPKN